MPPRFSNRAQEWKGETVVCTVRLARPLVDFIDDHLSEELKNRSEVLQDAVYRWALEEEDG
jgi:Arc/MetJ-type ribon-helix-helix transcriptional regulator